MNNVQAKSMKIAKKPPKIRSGDRSFICGGCKRAYRSYPALYLHIKKKHDGIKPPNTQCQKNFDQYPLKKPSVCLKFVGDIDDVGSSVLELEKVEEELFDFLGDVMTAISPFYDKPTLEHVRAKVFSISFNPKDEHLNLFKQKVETFFTEKEYENVRTGELDYESLKHNAPKDTIMVLVWFILWFGRYTVKLDFVPDLCLIFSRIWKVLSIKDLAVQDLDNKLVWNEVYKECQGIISDLTYFRDKDQSIKEFSKKLCQFMGKSFEE